MERHDRDRERPTSSRPSSTTSRTWTTTRSGAGLSTRLACLQLQKAHSIYRAACAVRRATATAPSTPIRSPRIALHQQAPVLANLHVSDLARRPMGAAIKPSPKNRSRPDGRWRQDAHRSQRSVASTQRSADSARGWMPVQCRRTVPDRSVPLARQGQGAGADSRQ
jgi:hypothetical protein